MKVIYKAEPLLNNRFILAESPFYNKKNNTLSWVDIVGKSFNYYRNNELKTIKFDEEIGAAVPTNKLDTYLICGTKALYLYDLKKVEKYLDLTNIFDNDHRCNDCKADPFGNLYFGSSVYTNASPSGNLYLLKDKKIEIMQKNTLISNGMAWNKNMDKFYFSDSLEHQIFVYDYDKVTNKISNRKKLCDITNGTPDGLCIDNNDNIWVCIWNGSRVECHSGIDGELLHMVEVDSLKVTSCCFIDNDLIITTSSLETDNPKSGLIYKVNVGISAKECDYFVIK